MHPARTIMMAYWSDELPASPTVLAECALSCVNAEPPCQYRINADDPSDYALGLGVVMAGAPLQFIYSDPDIEKIAKQPEVKYYGIMNLPPVEQATVLARYGFFDPALVTMPEEKGAILVFPPATQTMVTNLITLGGLAKWELPMVDELMFIRDIAQEAECEKSRRLSFLARRQGIPCSIWRCRFD